jgi:Ca2+-transporting ATPase
LQLATDLLTLRIFDKSPESKSGPLITLNMWKMIIGQSIYQFIVALVLNFAGNETLGYKADFQTSRLETVIFIIFV